MKILIPFLFSVFLLFVLTSCDPFKAGEIEAQANADKTAAQMLQDSLNQEQARAHAEDLHVIQMQQEELKQARRVAVEETVRTILSIILWVGGFAVMFTIALGSWSTVRAYQTAAAGITHAIVQAAEIRSRLIYLDDGRQFPAMLSGNTITDITTNAVTDTTRPNPGNPQSIAGAIANRHVGIVAKETRRAKKDVAENVPLSQNPPVIDVKFADVREYYEMVTGHHQWEEGNE